MRKHAKPLGIVSLALIGVFVSQAVHSRMSSERATQSSVQRESQTEDWAAKRAERLVARWETEYAEQGLYTKTPIHLGFSRAFSPHFTKARGKAEINFQAGQVNVSVDGLDPLADGSAYEVWLVENGLGPDNTAAIDLGEDGDRILNLGALPATGSLVASVNAEKLAHFNVDMAAVMRVAPGEEPEYIIGGMQSIRFKVGRQARMSQHNSSSAMVAAGFPPTLAAVGTSPMLLRSLVAAPTRSNSLAAQISVGEDLFVNGTFSGN